MKKKLTILGALALLLGLTSSPAGAQILSVEFNNGTPWQPGFSQDSTAPASATFGAYTVAVGGAAGTYQRTAAGSVVVNGGSMSDAALYNGFAYNASTSTPLDLSISGLTPGTQYSLTIWSYDVNALTAGFVKELFAPGGTTSGTSGTVLYAVGTGGEPTSNLQYTTTLLVTSTTGTIDILNTSSTSLTMGGTYTNTVANRINGFELDATPEPSTAAMALLGGTFLLFWVVRSRNRRLA